VVSFMADSQLPWGVAALAKLIETAAADAAKVAQK
jgi:hypothetical protein